MLTQLNYTVIKELLQEAETLKLSVEHRYTINEPTGNFFYDPWQLKTEYCGTVWEKIIKTLPYPIGEARIIVLKPGTTYNVHSDIDDRYHLNINGESCYLIDLDNHEMHKLNADGNWYEMDAGRLHTATNFGRYNRIQLVIRKLLNNNKLTNPIKIKLSSLISDADSARFIFDQIVSKWLNYANKNKIISNFSFNDATVEFEIEKNCLGVLQEIMPQEFKLEIQ